MTKQANSMKSKASALVDYEALGLRLKTMRQMSGMNVRKAAGRAGVSERSWRGWESGKAIRTDAFLKICRAFGCSIDWLAVGGESQ